MHTAVGEPIVKKQKVLVAILTLVINVLFELIIVVVVFFKL